MSPLLHSIVFAHLAMPTHTFAALDSLDLPAFVARLRSGACYGSAVTMPHKLAILPHLDELTLEATAVGACNTVTVTRRGDSEVPWLVGTNTDVIGIRESFYQNVTHPAEVRSHPRPRSAPGPRHPAPHPSTEASKLQRERVAFPDR